MAAPVKNLVDATAPSKAAYACEFHPISKPFRIINPYKCTSMSMLTIYTTTLPVRWQLVEIISKPCLIKVPKGRRIVKLNQAAVAAIKTFPAIYRERVSTRPTEGQIYPRGFYK